MNHRIYCGAYSDLEEKWLQEVLRLKGEDPLAPVNVLIGSNLLASYLKLRLAERGHAIVNLRFYTFLDLALCLSRAVPRNEDKVRLPHLGASAILESILAAGPPAVFHPVIGFAGFRDALLDTFRDLRDAGVSPEELGAGIRLCLAEAPDRKVHLGALARLYRLFREKAQRFHGIDDDFRAAAGTATRAPEILGGNSLLVYGIYDVTGQQADLLASLKDSFELSYFIPFVNDSVSSFAAPFVSSREVELKASVQAIRASAPDSGLGRLQKAGFGFQRRGDSREGQVIGTAAAAPDDGSFALVSAPGDSRAAIEIVREILRAVRDGVISGFHEAAVILRQPEAEVPVLTEALRLRKIPYFVEGGTSFARRPLARAVMSVANLAASTFSRRSILTAMEWISSALPPEASRPWDVAEFRSLTMNPRFLAGIVAWDDGTEALVRRASSELEQAEASPSRDLPEPDEDRPRVSARSARRRLALAVSLRRAWQDIRQAATGWPEILPWGDWAQLLNDRLEPLLKLSEDWSMFSTVLDEIGELGIMAGTAGIGGIVPWARFVAALEESFSSLNCPEGQFMRRGVNIMSTGAARGLRFPLVIIPGLDEGKFPARLRQDPLLFDRERRLIGRDARLPLKLRRGEEEKLLFDMAARAATRRLVLMTSRLDESSDREHIPSEFFLRTASAACGKPVALRGLTAEAVPGFRSVSLEKPWPPPGLVAVDRGEIRLRLVTWDPAGSRAALKALQDLEPDLIRRPLQYDESRWRRELTPFDGRLTDPRLVNHVKGLVGPSAGPVSASRLETYAKCPYLFYLDRVMELEAWEEPEAPLALDPLERGRTVHSILEKFLTHHAGEDLAIDHLRDLKSSLMALARPDLERARPPGIQDLLWEIEQEGLELLLKNWLRFERRRATDGLRPAFLEQPFGPFGPAEVYPELSIRAGDRVFVFRGRMDRIDLSWDGKSARVIDYKTGKLPTSMEKRSRTPLMSGEKMQIAVYASVVRRLEGLGNVERVIGEYLHLQPGDGKIISSAYGESELNEACARLPRLLEVLGDGIENGVFFARTSGSVRPAGHCEWCDFKAICGKDRVQRAARKAADPAVVRFERLAEIDRPLEGGR